VPKDPIVNEFAARQGDYREATVVDLTGELGGRRNSMVKVMLNRGGNAVDRWINDRNNRLFDEPQIEAIEHCRRLWARIDSKQSVMLGDGIRGAGVGQAEHDALCQLDDYKRRLGGALRPFWEVFENVVRFDMAAGQAGLALSSAGRPAEVAARTTVAFVAGMISQWMRT